MPSGWVDGMPYLVFNATQFADGKFMRAAREQFPETRFYRNEFLPLT